MALEASIGGSLQVLRQGVAAQGHKEDGLQRRVLPKGPRHIVAIHAGQADVAKDDVGPERASPLDPFRPAVGDFDRVLAEFERLAQTVCSVDVVLDDEALSLW